MTGQMLRSHFSFTNADIFRLQVLISCAFIIPPQELASGKPDSEKIMMLTEKINSLLEQVQCSSSSTKMK